jgi:hypothetical protein
MRFSRIVIEQNISNLLVVDPSQRLDKSVMENVKMDRRTAKCSETKIIIVGENKPKFILDRELGGHCDEPQ